METATLLATHPDPTMATGSNGSPFNGALPASMADVMKQPNYLQLPKVGGIIGGSVISVGRNEGYIDLDGVRTGVVRGKEIADESGTFANIAVGDRVEATVLEGENEIGLVELSFRASGHQKAWERLSQLSVSGENVSIKVVGANKGGLLVELERVAGFLPVSQLSQEHYPRVAGGDKQKILEKLLTFVGTTMDVKVLDVVEAEQKLIVSEKRVNAQRQEDRLMNYTVGDVVEGTVSGITPFGAFIRFGENFEGLVHISELAWQRIDNPADVLALGEAVTAKIIGLEGGKISLSRKQLIDDPWKHVSERYHIGERVTGKILKINPFGMFVELDPEIHGLAHISEFQSESSDPALGVKVGDVMEFKVISIDAAHHRLGLSRRAVDAPDAPATPPPTDDAPKEPTPEVSPDSPVAVDSTAETPVPSPEV